VRPSWVEIDLAAIRHNVALIAAEVAPSSVCAVVKADAYGHGDVPVAEAALDAGAGSLAVALPSEGVRLREAGIEAPILMLSEPTLEDIPTLIEWRLTPTVYRMTFAEALVAAQAPEPIPVHVKVDTGMHRVGAPHGAAVELAAYAATHPGLELGGVWTHLAVAEEDDRYTGLQIERFAVFLAELGTEGIDSGVRHCANTAGALSHPAARFDMVRLGLGMYGMRPAPAVGAQLDLRPAMRVVSRVAYLRRYEAGVRPSYGRRRPLPAAAWVATVPIGYADGIARRLSSTDGVVLVGGRRRPFAGTVTMDQVMVDVGDDPVGVGDEVVFLGAQGVESIGAEEWAARLETINYEVVCRFGDRLPRRYIGGVT
jgi:alanine racemase